MDEKIGFDCSQVLMRCDTVVELDEAMRIVNNMYKILREHLEVIEDINNSSRVDGRRICFLIGPGGKQR